MSEIRVSNAPRQTSSASQNQYDRYTNVNVKKNARKPIVDTRTSVNDISTNHRMTSQVSDLHIDQFKIKSNSKDG